MNERTLPFQGLRVILMIGIVGLHTYYKGIFGEASDLVPFYFVLSGFLYRDKLPWFPYMKKKVLGIYPFYLFIMGCSITICVLRGRFVLDWNIFPNLFIMEFWPIPNNVSYVSASWFVGSLLWCYAFSPLTAKHLLNKVKGKDNWLGVILCLFVIVLLQTVPYKSNVL